MSTYIKCSCSWLRKMLRHKAITKISKLLVDAFDLTSNVIATNVIDKQIIKSWNLILIRDISF